MFSQPFIYISLLQIHHISTIPFSSYIRHSLDTFPQAAETIQVLLGSWTIVQLFLWHNLPGVFARPTIFSLIVYSNSQFFMYQSSLLWVLHGNLMPELSLCLLQHDYMDDYHVSLHMFNILYCCNLLERFRLNFLHSVGFVM